MKRRLKMEEKKHISELRAVIYVTEIDKRFKRLERQNIVLLFTVGPIYGLIAGILHFPLLLTLLAIILIAKLIAEFCANRIIKFLKEVEKFWQDHEIDKDQI
jgi:hypothetical protein